MYGSERWEDPWLLEKHFQWAYNIFQQQWVEWTYMDLELGLQFSPLSSLCICSILRSGFEDALGVGSRRYFPRN